MSSTESTALEDWPNQNKYNIPKGAQDMIAFVLGKNQRSEVANYPNVTIPTNIIVNEEVKKNFGGFYH